jgi:DNA methylase
MKEHERRLYETPLVADRTGPLFNAVPYPTKISPETVALYIATHTLPGQTVLDPFCGSGSTGLAARLCDSPTERMLSSARSMNLRPHWGPRQAVLYDVGVFPALISEVMGNPPDPEAFMTAAQQVVGQAREIAPNLYRTLDRSGRNSEIRHVIWSELLECPHCGFILPFVDAAVSEPPLRMRQESSCPSCNTTSRLGAFRRLEEEVVDPLIKTKIIRRRRVPALVYGRTGTTTWGRLATAADAFSEEELLKAAAKLGAPVEPMEWADLRRTGYHTGITHLHHFYTARKPIHRPRLPGGLGLGFDTLQRSKPAGERLITACHE